MRVTVHVPETLGKKVEQLAQEKGVSISSLYAEAVEQHMLALKREAAFDAMEGLMGTKFSEDFDAQVAEIRRDDPNRLK